MSSSNLSKVAKSVLKDLKDSANKAPKSTRKQLERIDGQILLINRPRFMKNLITLIPSLAGPENQLLRDDIWNTYRDHLKRLERFIPPERLKELKACKIIGKKPNDHIFYIKRYRSAARAKGYALKRIITSVLSKRNRTINKEELGNLSKIGGSSNKFGAQLGHAEHINGVTVGFAASSVRVSAAKEKIERLSSSTSDKITLMKGITDYEDTMRITLKHNQVVDAKGIKKEYIPIISWQTALSNQELAQVEQVALKNFQSYLSNIVDNPGSSSLREALEQAFMYELSKGGKKLNKKIQGKRKQRTSNRSKSSSSTKVRRQRQVAVTKDNTLPSSLKQKNTTRKESSASQVLALIGILNSRLPSTVEQNMKPPALQYRTGRFAESVRVTEVSQTAQGYPSIGYTYQRYPYETFEPGNMQGSIERDPRRLIDRSIREIAAQFAIGRFYTRRL